MNVANNVEKVFKERLGTEEVADRIENLYFAYLFVLRAVMKVGPLLKSIDYQTGLIEEDTKTTNLVSQLVSAEPAMMGSINDAAFLSDRSPQTYITTEKTEFWS